MAKALLTKAAIKYLVETYDCETTNYTFADVSAMIAEKFGVKVTSEAVRRSYLKHKDAFNDAPVVNKAVSTQKTVKVFERPEQTAPSSNADGFNDNAAEELSKDSIKDLLN